MRKIMIPVLNRATYGRLKSVLKAVEAHPDLKLQVVLGASLFDAEIGFPIAYHAQCMVEGDNLAIMPLTTSMWIAQFTGIVENLKPDIIYIHGDRYESLGTALVAAYLNTPIAHGEGGEITGSIDERIRHSVTKLADIHFPVTESSKKRIIQMGENPDSVFVVGSTALDSLVGIDLSNQREKPYLVVLMHPNTKEAESIEPVFEAVSQFDLDTVVVNPNIDPGNKALLKRIHQQGIEFKKNLPVEEYARLIANCACLVGNTSSGIKECGWLGTPYVCVGNRQQGREMGNNVIQVSNDAEVIEMAMRIQLSHGHYPPDYHFGDGTAGKRIAEILSRIEVKEKRFYERW
jgi:UDP-hydrolysing UDP-N-acetyl-D-glucosamine 2-epimerase